MKRSFTYLLVLTLVMQAEFALAQILPNLGGQRAGISTLTFLKNDISPRSMAMGGSNLCLSADGMAVFHNPALMPQNEMIQLSATSFMLGAGMQQSWVSGIIPMTKSTSAVGFNLNYLSSGAMKVRTEFQPQGTGEYFYANQLATGLAYGKTLSDRFSFGVNLKYVYEQLAQYRNSTVAADLGFLYTTDVRGLKFGIVVKNFGGNTSLNGDYLALDYNRSGITLDKYAVPTVFRLGAAINAIEKDDHSLVAALQLEHPNDNSENIRIGLEYEYLNLLFLRTGYKINVTGERFPTFGVGFRPKLGRHSLMVNYGLNVTQYLGTLHSFGIDFGINNQGRS